VRDEDCGFERARETPGELHATERAREGADGRGGAREEGGRVGVGEATRKNLGAVCGELSFEGHGAGAGVGIDGGNGANGDTVWKKQSWVRFRRL
jgi:hypothetical protein